MRAFAKWSGFVLVMAGIAVFPVAMWVPGPWGVLSLLLVMAGCVLLVLVLRGGAMPPDESEQDADGARPPS